MTARCRWPGDPGDVLVDDAHSRTPSDRSGPPGCPSAQPHRRDRDGRDTETASRTELDRPDPMTSDEPPCSPHIAARARAAAVRRRGPDQVDDDR